MGFEQIKVDLLDWWPRRDREEKDGDREMALAAWVSTFDQEKTETKTQDDVLRVVSQMIDSSPPHESPKEAVWLKFFITAPIFCERQFDKYRMTVQHQDFQLDWYAAPFGRWGITQNELSGRYRTIPDRFYSLPVDVLGILEELNLRWAADEYHDLLKGQHDTYEKWLGKFPPEWRKRGDPNNWKYKRAREVFRGVLGVSFLTDMRIVANLNAVEHILNQRLATDAQVDSRVAAYRLYQGIKRAEVAPAAIRKMADLHEWEELCLDLERITGALT